MLRLKKYYRKLKWAGFSKSTMDYSKEIRFYKVMQNYTAFIVNLSIVDDDILVVYGAMSTAFTKIKNNEDALAHLGVSNEDITIREKVIISNKETEKTAKKVITDFYNDTKNLSKDELLSLSKSRRESFVNKFKSVLKTLGFTKKALTWTKKLADGYSLKFNLQKSAYSDTYYFNVECG